jgi:hypothetical protein
MVPPSGNKSQTFFYFSLLFFPFLCLGSQLPQDWAFCHQNYSSQIFPLSPPNKYLPWIWDAVLSSLYVEITTISRNACQFDHKQWQEVVNLYPKYKSELANGSETNLLLKIEQHFDYVNQNVFEEDRGASLIGSTFQCIYLDENGEDLYSTVSDIVQGSPHADLSSLQVRCPLPFRDDDETSSGSTWTMMRLDRYRFLPDNIVDVLATESFPVCGQDPSQITRSESMKKTVDQAVTSPSPSPRYDLTICTATSRATPPHDLIEWIEYHRLLGVDHLYIYDTHPLSLDINSSSVPFTSPLQHLLSPYVSEGLVTLVRWPYQNCVNGMASGRWVGYHVYTSTDGTPLDSVPEDLRPIHSSFKSEFRFFFPPRAISHTAALASCYARYRHDTQWMAHIDDDEYLVRPLSSLPLLCLSLSLCVL